MKILKKTLKESNESIELILDKYFVEKNKQIEIEDVVTLGFFEDLVEKIESLIILIEAEKSTALDTILRSIFENYVYLELLLFSSSNQKRYGRSYFVAKKIDNLKLYEKLVSKGSSGEKIREFLGNPDVKSITKLGNISDVQVEIQNEIHEFSDVFKYRKVNQAWYNLDGKTNNFEQLCNKKTMGMQAEYELLYRMLSKEVHAKDVLSKWRFKKDFVYILRSVSDSQMHISLSSIYLLRSIDLLYPFYGFNKRLKKFRAILYANKKFSK